MGTAGSNRYTFHYSNLGFFYINNGNFRLEWPIVIAAWHVGTQNFLAIPIPYIDLLWPG